MISTISGEIEMVADDAVVVRVSGLGFKVYVTREVVSRSRRGDPISLFTHLIVREDLLALYGFETEDERSFFELLIGVSGVGPKTALAILSTLNTETIRKAVLSEEVDLLSRVPGIGKKTAQKILMHLDGKIPVDHALQAAGRLMDADTEVLEALTGLGYSVVEAQAAIQSIPRDTPQEVETRLRIALQYFSG